MRGAVQQGLRAATVRLASELRRDREIFVSIAGSVWAVGALALIERAPGLGRGLSIQV